MGISLGMGMLAGIGGAMSKVGEDMAKRQEEERLAQVKAGIDMEHEKRVQEAAMNLEKYKHDLKANDPEKVSGTPGQWYIPPESTPFKDAETGVVGYKTKEGAIIPSRFAQTEYQQKMTDPVTQGNIASAKEAVKTTPVTMSDGSVQHLTNQQSNPSFNYAGIRPQGQSTGFQGYATPEDGVEAIHQNLISYANKHGINTVRGVVSRWSPNNENDTPALISNMSKYLNVKPDDEINLLHAPTRTLVASALMNQEHGSGNIIRQGLSIGQSTASKLADETEAKRQQGINSAALKPGGESNPNGGLSDDAIMQQAIAYNSGMKLNAPRGVAGIKQNTAVVNLAAELRKKSGQTIEELNKNQLDYPVIQKTLNNYSGSSPGAKAVNSFNVSFSHLKTLEDLADAMHNGNIPAINKLSNYLGTQTGSTAPTTFDAAKKIVSDELTKGIIGGQTASGDREETAKNLNAAQTPEQLKSVTGALKDLLHGQLEGHRLVYTNGTKRDDFDHMLQQPVLDYIHEKNGISSNAPTTPSQAITPNKMSDSDLLNHYLKKGG